MLGGAQYLKSRVFLRERRRREAMLGGSGGMLPRKIFDKNGAIRCILVHSMAHFSLEFITLLFLRLSFFFLNVAFDMLTSLKTKKKNLKYGFKSGTDLTQQALLPSKKKVQAGLELRLGVVDLKRYQHMSTAMQLNLSHYINIISALSL